MEISDALSILQQPLDLTILDLSAPILHPPSPNTAKRTSDASDSSTTAQYSPALLAADLAHYRDLFSKLRFSYVEQVTKERFLRSITANPPDFVDAAENVELEAKLSGDKAALKERKEEVRVLIQELEEQGRSLAGRYEDVGLRRARLETLPEEIQGLEEKVADLQARQAPSSSNPSLAMPLQPTLELLGEKENQLSDLDAQIAALQAALPGKRQEVERLQDDLAPLQMRKIKAVQEAQEARRRRADGGGLGDELEEKGRWLRGVEAGLRGMLEV